MAKQEPSRKLKYGRAIGGEQLSDAKAQNAEELLARLVASAFAADHPELFHAETVASTGQVPTTGLELP
jgi:hypothetical protein